MKPTRGVKKSVEKVRYEADPDKNVNKNELVMKLTQTKNVNKNELVMKLTQTKNVNKNELVMKLT